MFENNSSLDSQRERSFFLFCALIVKKKGFWENTNCAIAINYFCDKKIVGFGDPESVCWLFLNLLILTTCYEKCLSVDLDFFGWWVLFDEINQR